MLAVAAAPVLLAGVWVQRYRRRKAEAYYELQEEPAKPPALPAETGSAGKRPASTAAAGNTSLFFPCGLLIGVVL